MWRKWIEESFDESGIAEDLLSVLVEDGIDLLEMARDELENRDAAREEDDAVEPLTARWVIRLLEESDLAVGLAVNLFDELDQTLEILGRKPPRWKFWYRWGVKWARGQLRKGRDYVRSVLLDA